MGFSSKRRSFFQIEFAELRPGGGPPVAPREVPPRIPIAAKLAPIARCQRRSDAAPEELLFSGGFSDFSSLQKSRCQPRVECFLRDSPGIRIEGVALRPVFPEPVLYVGPFARMGAHDHAERKAASNAAPRYDGPGLRISRSKRQETTHPDGQRGYCRDAETKEPRKLHLEDLHCGVNGVKNVDALFDPFECFIGIGCFRDLEDDKIAARWPRLLHFIHRAFGFAEFMRKVGSFALRRGRAARRRRWRLARRRNRDAAL